MTIPASDIVVVNPGVVGSGGNPLALNGVILSKNTLLPTGGVRSFASADAVSAFFGPSSTEYALAQTYFLGFDKPEIVAPEQPFDAVNVHSHVEEAMEVKPVGQLVKVCPRMHFDDTEADKEWVFAG